MLSATYGKAVRLARLKGTLGHEFQEGVRARNLDVRVLLGERLEGVVPTAAGILALRLPGSQKE